MVTVLVPVVSIFELTNALLAGGQLRLAEKWLAVSAPLAWRLQNLYFPDAQKNPSSTPA